MVVGLGATRARPSRCAPRDGVLGIVGSWHLWHQCCGITCGRTPRRVPVRHTPGAATAAPSSIELLNWRTRPPISATPCVMCVMAATRRSDARTEVTSEVTQHRNVMRTSCASAASAERCRTGSPRGGSRRAPTGVQGPRGPRATQPRSCAARGAVAGVAGFRICRIEAHTQVPTATARPRRSTAERSGGAFGVWGRTPGTGVAGSADPAYTRHRDQGFGRHGTSECDNVARRLRWGPCLLTVCCNVAGHM